MFRKTANRRFRSRGPLTHTVTIPVPVYDANYPGYTKAIEWCERNCRGGWKYNQNGEFLFERDSDVALFSLNWRKAARIK